MKKNPVLFFFCFFFCFIVEAQQVKFHYYTHSGFVSGNYFFSFSDQSFSGFSFGTNITFLYYSNDYDKKSKEWKIKINHFHYQPSVLLFPSEIKAFFRNNFLFSFYNYWGRTGPFAGFNYDVLNAGLGFKNELTIIGSQQAGLLLNYIHHPQNYKRRIHGFHMQVGAGYYFELNKKSGAKNQLMIEFSLRHYLKRIPVGGF